MNDLFGPATEAEIREFATDALVVRIPRGLRSKQKLLGIYAERLRFPRYFGGNWDALEECLRDLSWLPADQSVVVVHEDLPFSDGANRRAYLSVLQSWQQHAHQTKTRSMRLVMVES